MTPPEKEALRKIIADWLNKACLDMDAAEALLSRDPPLLYPACFHSQQASEKYLKAFLTWKQVEFPKTHNIGQLLSLIATVDRDLAARLKAAEKLTPFGVDIRYPGDQAEPTADEAQEALDLAEKVCEAILPLLRGETA